MTTSDTAVAPRPRHAAIAARALTIPGDKLALGLILLIAAFMDFWGLDQNGYSNVYYAAAVKSMLQSWHNFFFVSFDPGGFVTVDKPPLGFWMQTASAKIFGFSGVSILLPEALAGVLSVALVYYLVRRAFGTPAGLLAALTLALTPISVAVNRNNTIDSLLVFTLLLGAWAITRAAETGRLRLVLLSALLVGLGFNIKMAQAYMVLPAFCLVYLLGAPRGWRVRIGHLLLAAIVVAVVSLSWIVAVDAVPASQRPYVDSSSNNTELDLALHWNGVNRVSGFGPPGGEREVPFSRPPGSGNTASGSNRPKGRGRSSASSVASGNMPGVILLGSCPAGSKGSRTAQGSSPCRQAVFAATGPGAGSGILRFLATDVAGQISWLLPLAFIGLVVAGRQMWCRQAGTAVDLQTEGKTVSAASASGRRYRALLLWGTWLLAQWAFFSFTTGFTHPYYVVMMGPGLAALVGIGAVALWQDYRTTRWRGWLLPIALLTTAGVDVDILQPYPDWSHWMAPSILIPCGLAAGLLAVGWIAQRRSVAPEGERGLLSRLITDASVPRRAATAGIGLAAASLLLAPTVWAAQPVFNGGADLPSAGPTTGGPMGRLPIDSSADSKLLRYLERHRGKAKYLVMTPSVPESAAIILATGQAVMTPGGFLGGDRILTPHTLAAMVARGEIRYFLIDNVRPGGGFLGGPSLGIEPGGREPRQEHALPRRAAPGAASSGRRLRHQYLPPKVMLGGPNGSGTTDRLEDWVRSHCSKVPARYWQSDSDSGSAPLPQGMKGFSIVGDGQKTIQGPATPGQGLQLYDCGSYAAHHHSQ